MTLPSRATPSPSSVVVLVVAGIVGTGSVATVPSVVGGGGGVVAGVVGSVASVVLSKVVVVVVVVVVGSAAWSGQGRKHNEVQ